MDIDAFFRACSDGNLEYVKQSILGGVDKNAKDHEGKQAIHHACVAGNLPIMEWLASHGAQVNARDNANMSCLHFACLLGHHDIAKWLLWKKVLKNNRNAEGMTPLLCAAANGHLDVVKLLIKESVFSNAVNKDGNNALHLAQLHGHAEVVKWLLANGFNANAKNKDGKTPDQLLPQTVTHPNSSTEARDISNLESMKSVNTTDISAASVISSQHSTVDGTLASTEPSSGDDVARSSGGIRTDSVRVAGERDEDERVKAHSDVSKPNSLSKLDSEVQIHDLKLSTGGYSTPIPPADGETINQAEAVRDSSTAIESGIVGNSVEVDLGNLNVVDVAARHSAEDDRPALDVHPALRPSSDPASTTLSSSTSTPLPAHHSSAAETQQLSDFSSTIEVLPVPQASASVSVPPFPPSVVGDDSVKRTYKYSMKVCVHTDDQKHGESFREVSIPPHLDWETLLSLLSDQLGLDSSVCPPGEAPLSGATEKSLAGPKRTKKIEHIIFSDSEDDDLTPRIKTAEKFYKYAEYFKSYPDIFVVLYVVDTPHSIVVSDAVVVACENNTGDDARQVDVIVVSVEGALQHESGIGVDTSHSHVTRMEGHGGDDNGSGRTDEVAFDDKDTEVVAIVDNDKSINSTSELCNCVQPLASTVQGDSGSKGTTNDPEPAYEQADELSSSLNLGDFKQVEAGLDRLTLNPVSGDDDTSSGGLEEVVPTVVVDDGVQLTDAPDTEGFVSKEVSEPTVPVPSTTNDRCLDNDSIGSASNSSESASTVSDDDDDDVQTSDSTSLPRSVGHTTAPIPLLTAESSTSTAANDNKLDAAIQRTHLHSSPVGEQFKTAPSRSLESERLRSAESVLTNALIPPPPSNTINGPVVTRSLISLIAIRCKLQWDPDRVGVVQIEASSPWSEIALEVWKHFKLDNDDGVLSHLILVDGDGDEISPGLKEQEKFWKHFKNYRGDQGMYFLVVRKLVINGGGAMSSSVRDKVYGAGISVSGRSEQVTEIRPAP